MDGHRTAIDSIFKELATETGGDADLECKDAEAFVLNTLRRKRII